MAKAILVSQIASRNLIGVNSEDTLDKVAKTMIESKVRRIVIYGPMGSLVGIVSARSIVRAALNNDNWKTVKVSEISSRPVSVDSRTNVKDASRLMLGLGLGSLLVENTSIVTERDIAKIFPRDVTIPAIEVGSKSVLTLLSNSTVKEAGALMIGYGISHVPVLDQNTRKIIGIISLRDVLRAFVEDKANSPVTDYASKEVIKLDERSTLGDVANLISTKDVGSVIIIDDKENIRAIVTEWDLVKVTATLTYAYVLIKLAPNASFDVNPIQDLDRVIDARLVYGPYDIVATIAGETSEKLLATVALIRSIPGIADTLTLLSV